jgi:hypothetical protein
VTKVVAKTEIFFNIASINELMSSEPVAELVLTAAEMLAARAGPGWVAQKGTPHKWVARAYVVPEPHSVEGIKALVREARDKVLTRAVGGMG